MRVFLGDINQCSGCKSFKTQNCVKEIKCAEGYYYKETQIEFECLSCRYKCKSCKSEYKCE